MTSKTNFITLLSLTLSLCSSAQKDCNYQVDTAKILSNANLDSFLAKIKADRFSTSFDKNDIPVFIKKQLNCWTHNFTIANPEEPFNATDIYNKHFPDRQLIFLAKSKELFVMTYVLGGIVKSTHILLIRHRGNKIYDMWTGVGVQHFKSIGDILDYIETCRNKGCELNTNFIEL